MKIISDMKNIKRVLLIAVIALFVSVITGCSSNKPKDNGNSVASYISGKVLNWENKPIQRAFVMVKEKPSYSAMVNAKGEFSIPVSKDLSTMNIIISSPGCKTIEKKINLNEKIEVTLTRQDQLLSQIEVGAAHVLLSDMALVRMYNFREYTKAQKQCVDLYNEFRVTKGAEILKKILANEQLTNEEAPYYYVAMAGYLAGAAVPNHPDAKKRIAHLEGKLGDEKCKEFYKETKQEGEDILRKGFEGGKITKDEISKLRLLSIIYGLEFRDNVVYPIQLNEKERIPGKEGVAIGNKIPGMRFVKFEDIVESQDYRDYPALDLCDFIRPEGLSKFLLAIKAYGSEESIINNNSIGIKDLLHGKPILIFNKAILDNFGMEAMAYMEYCYQTYKDEADIYILSVRTKSLSNYGEMNVPSDAFYGANPNADPLNGLDSRKNISQFSSEDFARVAKNKYLKFPSQKVPLLLDCMENISSNTQIESGWRRAMLFDKEGKVVSDNADLYYNELGSFRRESSYLWTRLTSDYRYFESALISLLENDGKLDKNIDYSKSYMEYLRSTVPTQYAFQTPFEYLFEVEDILIEKNEIVARWEGNKDDSENLFTFQIDKSTVVFTSDEDVVKPGSISDLAIGDKLQIDVLSEGFPNFKGNRACLLEEKYYPKKDIGMERWTKLHSKTAKDVVSGLNKTLKAVRIYKEDSQIPWFNMIEDYILFNGIIEKVKNNRITVVIDTDFSNEYSGYAMYKRDKNKIIDIDEFSRFRIDQLEKSLGSGNPVKKQFEIDKGVRVIHDAYESDRSALKVGQRVLVNYRKHFDKQNDTIIHPDFIIATTKIK